MIRIILFQTVPVDFLIEITAKRQFCLGVLAKPNFIFQLFISNTIESR